MSDGIDRIREQFINESLAQTVELIAVAQGLDHATGPVDEPLARIRGDVHQIKGAAGMLGLTAVRDAAIAVEQQVAGLPHEARPSADDAASLAALLERLSGLLKEA